MSQIANLTGHTEDAQNYTTIAHDYITKWQDLGIAKTQTPPHTTLQYGNETTHGMYHPLRLSFLLVLPLLLTITEGVLYNIYNDALLSLDLVPQSVYDMQSSFYPTVMNTYGAPLDTRHDYTKVDWLVFAAAVASQETKTLFIENLGKWLGETGMDRAFTDLYDTKTGLDPPGLVFTARPVIGGVFAMLALPGAVSSRA